MVRPRGKNIAGGRLISVELDEVSIGTNHDFIDVERATAVNDLLAENSFLPTGRSGAFRLRISVIDKKLVLDLAEADDTPVARHILSLTPLARVVKDYFLICESYYQALR